MSKDAKLSDDIVSRIKLDIRALTLLYESDADLRPILEKALVESQDEYVTRFVRLVQPRRKEERTGSIPMALGEMVLASFLTIVGLSAFVPAMMGLSSPGQWTTYLSSVLAPSASGPVSSGIPILDLVLAALLLVGAFYSLREAAKSLKNAGMILEPRGS